MGQKEEGETEARDGAGSKGRISPPGILLKDNPKSQPEACFPLPTPSPGPASLLSSFPSAPLLLCSPSCHVPGLHNSRRDAGGADTQPAGDGGGGTEA